MKEIEICECCKRKMMIHKHTFSKGLATILIKAVQQIDPGKPFHLQKDLNLSKNEYVPVRRYARAAAALRLKSDEKAKSQSFYARQKSKLL